MNFRLNNLQIRRQTQWNAMRQAKCMRTVEITNKKDAVRGERAHLTTSGLS